MLNPLFKIITINLQPSTFGGIDENDSKNENYYLPAKPGEPYVSDSRYEKVGMYKREWTIYVQDVTMYVAR